MILEPRGSRNRPKWCQGALRKRPWEQVGKSEVRLLLFLRFFGDTWAILTDFWDPSKSGWAPKTTQKIQYGYFLVPLGDQSAEKIGFGRRLERTGKFDQKSRRKGEAAKVDNH